MQRYLGSKMTIYCAVVLLIITLVTGAFSSLYAVSLWNNWFNTDDAIVFGVLAVLFIVMCYYLNESRDQFFTWGTFSADNVEVRTLFEPKRTLEYKSFKSCGIGRYHHGIYGSGVGSTIYFIYFSQYVFDESYKNRINMWQPSLTRVKVEFDKKLYDYLLTVLPAELADALRRDYELYFD